MSDKKLSELTSGAPLQDADLLYIARGEADRRVAFSDFATAIQAKLENRLVPVRPAQPDSAKFLSEDGTFRIPAGGPGGGPAVGDDHIRDLAREEATTLLGQIPTRVTTLEGQVSTLDEEVAAIQASGLTLPESIRELAASIAEVHVAGTPRFVKHPSNGLFYWAAEVNNSSGSFALTATSSPSAVWNTNTAHVGVGYLAVPAGVRRLFGMKLTDVAENKIILSVSHGAGSEAREMTIRRGLSGQLEMHITNPSPTSASDGEIAIPGYTPQNGDDLIIEPQRTGDPNSRPGYGPNLRFVVAVRRNGAVLSLNDTTSIAGAADAFFGEGFVIPIGAGITALKVALYTGDFFTHAGLRALLDANTDTETAWGIRVAGAGQDVRTISGKTNFPDGVQSQGKDLLTDPLSTLTRFDQAELAKSVEASEQNIAVWFLPAALSAADGVPVANFQDLTGGNAPAAVSGKIPLARGSWCAVYDPAVHTQFVRLIGVLGSGGGGGSTPGDAGNDGWSPVLAAVVDGERRVWQVADWQGGTGTKPTTGKYLGPSGFVDTAAEATDVRGAKGEDGADAEELTGADIVAKLAALTADARLSYNSLKDLPDLLALASNQETALGAIADKAISPDDLLYALQTPPTPEAHNNVYNAVKTIAEAQIAAALPAGSNGQLVGYNAAGQLTAVDAPASSTDTDTYFIDAFVEVPEGTDITGGISLSSGGVWDDGADKFTTKPTTAFSGAVVYDASDLPGGAAISATKDYYRFVRRYRKGEGAVGGTAWSFLGRWDQQTAGNTSGGAVQLDGQLILYSSNTGTGVAGTLTFANALPMDSDWENLIARVDDSAEAGSPVNIPVAAIADIRLNWQPTAGLNGSRTHSYEFGERFLEYGGSANAGIYGRLEGTAASATHLTVGFNSNARILEMRAVRGRGAKGETGAAGADPRLDAAATKNSYGGRWSGNLLDNDQSPPGSGSYAAPELARAITLYRTSNAGSTVGWIIAAQRETLEDDWEVEIPASGLVVSNSAFTAPNGATAMRAWLI